MITVIRNISDDLRGRLLAIAMVLVIRAKLPDDHCHQKDCLLPGKVSCLMIIVLDVSATGMVLP
jgi:hypothetical protein